MNLFKQVTTAILALMIFSSAYAINNIPDEETLFQNTPSSTPENPKEVMLIHGLFVTADSWGGWLEYFSDRGYKVSAPAWPYHEDIEKLRENPDVLRDLPFEHVLTYYRSLLQDKKSKPILVGHSMGGLIAQILLSEGLGSAAVAIHPAPHKGILSFEGSFYKANKGVFNPIAWTKPMEMSLEEFSYAFTNAQSEEFQRQAYEKYYVPTSRRAARGPLTGEAAMVKGGSNGSLLIIAGGRDHIVPASLNYKNFKKYETEKGSQRAYKHVSFKMFPYRDHWTIAAPGWEDVADYAYEWMEKSAFSKFEMPKAPNVYDIMKNVPRSN